MPSGVLPQYAAPMVSQGSDVVPSGRAHAEMLGATLIWLIFSLLLAAIVLTLINHAQRESDGRLRARAIASAIVAADLPIDGSAMQQMLHTLTGTADDLVAIQIWRDDQIRAESGMPETDSRHFEVQIDHTQFVIVLGDGYESVFQLYGTMGTLAALGLVFLLMSVFLVIMTGRLVGRPIAVLQQRASRLASGDLRPPSENAGMGDFGGVASMMEHVRRRMESERAEHQGTADELSRTNSLQRLMLRELNHRIRNNLASLASLVTVSRVGEDNMPEFAARIERRIGAMSSVHALLSERQWAPVSLHDLVHRLSPTECEERMTVAGAEVTIGASQATPLAMVLQEMYANAMEHGSLASGTGWLRIQWDIAGDPSGADVLVLTWQETGGPPPDPNAEAGTGTSLIRGLIEGELRGEVRLQHTPDGVSHELRIPTLPSAGM